MQIIKVGDIQELLNELRTAHDMEPLKHWSKDLRKKPYIGVENSPPNFTFADIPIWLGVREDLRTDLEAVLYFDNGDDSKEDSEDD